MDDSCEVCAKHRPRAKRRPGRIVTVARFKERDVMLCRAHMRIAQSNDVKSLEDLRELFGESEGKRSYIARRRPRGPGPLLDTRKFGRRADDTLEAPH